MTMETEREYDPDRQPPHPGGIIKDYMKADGWTQSDLADVMNVSRSNLNKVINGNGGIGPKMAHKLAVVFDTDPRFWAELNVDYKLGQAHQACRAELEAIRQSMDAEDSADGVPA